MKITQYYLLLEPKSIDWAFLTYFLIYFQFYDNIYDVKILQTSDDPPALAGHTLTLRSVGEKESLILIGGFSPDHGFLEDVWEYDLQTENWKKFKMSGYGPAGKCLITFIALAH